MNTDQRDDFVLQLLTSFADESSNDIDEMALR